MNNYHTLLPQHLQDVLKNAVNKKRGKTDRLTDIQYMARIDKAIAKVTKSFPQAFIKKG